MTSERTDTKSIFKNITINRNVKMATTDPEGNDDDDDNRGITSILTVDDMLITGLSLGGYTVPSNGLRE